MRSRNSSETDACFICHNPRTDFSIQLREAAQRRCPETSTQQSVYVQVRLQFSRLLQCSTKPWNSRGFHISSKMPSQQKQDTEKGTPAPWLLNDNCTTSSESILQ